MLPEQLILLVVGLLIAYGIGCLGRKRSIGFWWAFILSIINPIIALIIVLCSKKLNSTEYFAAGKGKKL